jgi:hypothetical protein
LTLEIINNSSSTFSVKGSTTTGWTDYDTNILAGKTVTLKHKELKVNEAVAIEYTPTHDKLVDGGYIRMKITRREEERKLDIHYQCFFLNYLLVHAFEVEHDGRCVMTIYDSKPFKKKLR